MSPSVIQHDLAGSGRFTALPRNKMPRDADHAPRR